MMTLKKTLVNFLLSISAILLLSGCAGKRFKTSDWEANMILPASQDCWGLKVMSREETTLPADSEECKKKKQRSVFLTYDAYIMLRGDVLDNCQFAACTQMTGTFDKLFLSIDKGLQKIPNGGL